MANMTGAVAGLVSLGSTVAGVQTSLGLDHFFDKLLGVQLPCLIVAHDLADEQGFSTLAFNGKNAQDRFTLLHYLLYKPYGGTADQTAVMPGLVALKDAYFTALVALPFLGPLTAPAVHQPSLCKTKFGAVEWNGVAYHAAIFHHDLEINL